MPQKSEDLGHAGPANSYTDSMAELLTPCGRFSAPDSLATRASWMAARLLSRLNLIHKDPVPRGSTVPLNWQRMALYLRTAGITTESIFRNPPQRAGAEHIEQFFLTIDRSKRTTDGAVPQFDTGFGASRLKEEALSKTVGETLERFFLSTYRRDELLLASPHTLAHDHRPMLDLATLNTYEPWQKSRFPEFVHNQLSEFRFVEGRSYPDNAPVLLPAQLVFWNYRHDTEVREPVLARPTTSGSAGHFTRDEAILAGLLEVIQRDGFFIWWLNSLSPSVLDISVLNDASLNEFVQEQQKTGVTLTFLNTASDVRVPTITCVAVKAAGTDHPVISVGSASGFQLHELLMHSAVEAVQVNSYAASRDTYVIDESFEPFTDATMQREARLCAWKGPLMASRFAFFMRGAVIDPRAIMTGMEHCTDTPSQLRHIINDFESKGPGYEVYIYEPHDPVLDHLGYHVTRVIVPQLFPLYLSEYAAPLHSKRLHTVPLTLGKKPAQKLNPWPHPFP